MTRTCNSCYEDPLVCRYVGTDRRECEHPVRADDIEVEPPDESPDLPGMMLAECVDDIARLTQAVEEIIAWRDAFVASVVRASAGDER